VEQSQTKWHSSPSYGFLKAGLKSLHYDQKLKMQKSKFALLSFIMCASLTPAQSLAEECVKGFKELALTTLSSPTLEGGDRLCAGDLRGVARDKGYRFITADEQPDLPEGVQGLLELAEPGHEITHFLRQGKYYGEFIDRRLTQNGGNSKAVSLILREKSGIADKALEALKFFYISEEYQWGKERVERLERKFTPVSMKSDGGLAPHGAAETSLAVRRLAILVFPVMDELSLAIYYYDPQLADLRLFRSFPVMQERQRTVLQFVKDSSGVVHPALIRIQRDGQQIGELKVSDPGADNIEIQIRIN